VGKKQYRVIDASMGLSEALDCIKRNNMTAAFYQVPQGDDIELAEAMRLLSGMGYVLKHRDTGLTVGKFVSPDNSQSDSGGVTGCSLGDHYGASNVVPVDFGMRQRVTFDLHDAIR